MREIGERIPEPQTFVNYVEGAACNACVTHRSLSDVSTGGQFPDIADCTCKYIW
jgi:hypothetical protein